MHSSNACLFPPPHSRSVMESLRKSVMELGEPRQLILPPCQNCGENRVVMARQVRKEDMEANPIFAEFLRQQQQQQQAMQQQQQQKQLRREQSDDSPPMNGVNGIAAAAFRRTSKASRWVKEDI